jgi:hypothetical protein
MSVNPSPANDSSGFILVERAVQEMRAGKSPSLDKWSAQLRTGLAKFRETSKGPKNAKDAQAVEKALESAHELVQAILHDIHNQ